MRMQVGDISIESMIDGVARLAPDEMYRLAPNEPLFSGRGHRPEDWLAHADLLDDDGMFEAPVGGFLIRSGDRLVMVDGGYGPSPPAGRPGGQLLNELVAAGVTAADVTDLVLTLLHRDHVGWVSHRDTPIFPNAVIRCHEADVLYFIDDGPDPVVSATMAPVMNRLETWSVDGPLMPGIDVRHMPGHTPGSSVLVVSSGSERVLLLGDVVHCAVELIDDEWEGMADVDPALAQRTRAALARELEREGTPAAGAHFPDLRFGRLLPGTSSRRWYT